MKRGWIAEGESTALKSKKKQIRTVEGSVTFAERREGDKVL